MEIIKANWAMKRPVRMLGISAQALRKDGEEQISLFEVADKGKKDKLDRAIDIVRERFGKDALKFAWESDFKEEYSKEDK